MVIRNREWLTFHEWCAAAHVLPPISGSKSARAYERAWLAAVDPTEYANEASLKVKKTND